MVVFDHEKCLMALLDLIVPGKGPQRGVADHTGTHHIGVDV